MILLAAASCLLFFISYFTGICTVNFFKKFLSIDFAANALEIFLFGLITSYTYFNLLSFFIPVNYITLLPLLGLSLFLFSKKAVRQHFFVQVRQIATLFLSREKLPYTLPLIAMLLVYWIIPPMNRDSGEYHYIAIRWYEQFKIVPDWPMCMGALPLTLPALLSAQLILLLI
jgi:hypothetical protein